MKYRMILFIATLIITSLACGITARVPTQQLPNPSVYILVTYVYAPSAQGGVNFALFAENSVANPAITFAGGETPSLEDVKQMTSQSPVSDLRVSISDGTSTVEGTTSQDGHVSLTAPFTEGNASLAGGWYCETITSWQTSNDGSTIHDGGAVIHCYK